MHQNGLVLWPVATPRYRAHFDKWREGSATGKALRPTGIMNMGEAIPRVKWQRKRRLRALCAALFASLSAAHIAGAQAPEDFYKGKQVRMIIPAGAGGGYDTYARVLSQHLEN